jgi:hypothetical protein
MSWLFSRALVEEYSVDTCSDGALSAPLSGNPTQQAYLSPDKMTAFSRLSRFGMTCKLLTDGLGEELLTSYLAAFRVRTLVQPGKEPELTEPGPECGRTWHGSLAKYDPSTSSWKTAQSSLAVDLGESLVTWPRWGLMRNGECWEQPTLERRIKEIESGSWPTPTVTGNYNRKGASATSGNGLATAVTLWPTPTAAEGSKIPATANYGQVGLNNHPRIRGEVTRPKQVKSGKFPTPTAHNSKEGGYPAEFTRNTPSLNAVALGGTQTQQMPLNPVWVEWLMGWPLGWTDLRPLATDKFRQWQRQHGECSSD